MNILKDIAANCCYGTMLLVVMLAVKLGIIPDMSYGD